MQLEKGIVLWLIGCILLAYGEEKEWAKGNLPTGIS